MDTNPLVCIDKVLFQIIKVKQFGIPHSPKCAQYLKYSMQEYKNLDG